MQNQPDINFKLKDRAMKKILTILYMSFIFLSCTGIISCKKDDNNHVEINSVWNHEMNTESTQIKSTYFNRWIRLHGQGFEGVQKIYLNGNEVGFNPVLITNTDIIVNVPRIPVGAAVTDIDQLNTVRIRTKTGDAIYKDLVFKDPNKIPNVSGVTNTMPFPGETIEITGSNLTNTTKVYFPGDLEAEIISVSDSRVEVKAPPSLNRSISGSMKMIADGDEFLSPPFMFYSNGIFLKTFMESATTGTSGANTNAKVINIPSEIAAATGIPSNNPEAVLAIPNVPKNLPVVTASTWAGLFRFRAFISFQELIDNPSSKISGSTSLQDLAIQFELYMTQPWKSGYISLGINKNASASTGAYRYNLYGGTPDKPVNFSGKWLTMTVPFSNFKNLALGSLSDYVNTIKGNGYETVISFSNSNPENDGHTPQVINNFQMFIANMRLVPLR